MARSLRYDIEHTTTYEYEEEINSCVMSLCMQPRSHRRQTVNSFHMQTTPNAAFGVEFDAFGNRHHVFNIHQAHQQLDITVAAVIEHEVAESTATESCVVTGCVARTCVT